MFDPATKEELLDCVKAMEKARTDFYYAATRTGCHPFIEFCGFMGEYVKACRRLAEQGIDFRYANTHSGRPLPLKTYEAEYLAEKFDCIFGPSIRANAEVSKVFHDAVFGDTPKGLEDAG